jgi:hypothetical protein
MKSYVRGAPMHKTRHLCSPKPVLTSFCFAILLICCTAAIAQKRPVDEGDVKETRPEPRVIRRPPRVTPRPSRPANSVLIIKTYPENATVEIDGLPTKSTAPGEFSKELLANKIYTIKVAAGPNYQTNEQRISLKAGQPKILDVTLTYRFGSVKLGPAIEGAKIYLDDLAVSSDKYNLDESSGLILINDLPEGEHIIKYDHPDYVILERKFKISPGSQYTWTFLPKRALVEMRVKTNAGAAIYLDNEPKGTTTSDGTLKLSEIRIGDHEIKLAKDGFQDYKVTRRFEFGKPVDLDHQLEPLATATEFQDDFDIANTSRWTMPPSGWSIKSGRLHIANSPLIGFPTDLRYFDFEMHFLLRLTNAGGATWALHIKDPNNYYLFYLSGPEGLFPNRFITYIVIDNKLDPHAPVSSVPVPMELKAGGDYTIEITASKNIIEHAITPAATGERIRFGFFEDPKHLFPYGNIGFRTVAQEQFSIDELFVLPKGH